MHLQKPFFRLSFEFVITPHKNQMKQFLFTAICCFLLIASKSQTPIDVAENTMKVPSQGDQVFYYGFAEGDQLVFNFEEVDGKELKELEISFMPSNSIYMEYKTKKIENKVIQIRETGVYKFRFTNTNLFSGRVCKFKIQRIPGSDATKKFNTTVYNRVNLDTSYADIQEKFITKSDTSFQELVNQVVTVHSVSSLQGSKKFVTFFLPANTVAWSYYIGVGEPGNNMYQSAAKELRYNSNNQIAGNPINALTLGVYPFLHMVENGDQVRYYLVEGDNANQFAMGKPFNDFKHRKVVNDYERMEIVKNSLSLCFENDNVVSAVNVLVKVTAMKVNAVYDLRMVHKMNVKRTEEMYLKN